jgi:hypothetical protein
VLSCYDRIIVTGTLPGASLSAISEFARDSLLEEGVCCELVSEIGLSGECRNKA